MTTALVVDDFRDSADSLCAQLIYLKLNAYPAYGARAGIEALKDTLPDIVFMDINMPGMDGFDVIAFLRREPSLYNVPVIIITADDSPETIERARRIGAIDVLIKPSSLEAVEQALRTAKIID